jgi:hypothetical protein
MALFFMRKDIGMKVIVALILLTVFVTVYFVIAPYLPQKTIDLSLGNGSFKAAIASNDTARAKGLSGVSELSDDQALLMVFPTSSKWGIWMKDMSIPIDIVWLDGSKKVIYIVKNAQPAEPTLRTFVPKADAVYVVELPAGTVDRKAILINSEAVFDISGIVVE